jgi:tRNA 2-thiouridine synthesizing protein A
MIITIDLKGLSCPLPVLRVRKRMTELAKGDVARVLATDPGAPRDIEAYCKTSGNAFLGARDEAGVFIIELRRDA